VTDRGRKRRRRVAVDLAAVRARFGAVRPPDRAVWEQMRGLLRAAVGESAFAIWLEAMELIAVDGGGVLVVSAPDEIVAWVRGRYGAVIGSCAARAGREVRIADERERLAVLRPPRDVPVQDRDEPTSPGGSHRNRAAAARSRSRALADSSAAASTGVSVDGSGDWRADSPSDRSTYTSSYTHVYKQQKEVS